MINSNCDVITISKTEADKKSGSSPQISPHKLPHMRISPLVLSIIYLVCLYRVLSFLTGVYCGWVSFLSTKGCVVVKDRNYFARICLKTQHFIFIF